jgi:hypothetical protein
MTEEQWLACEDPIDMLLVPPGKTVGERKLRLFAAACCRRVWDVLSPDNRAAVEVAERYADGLATRQDLTHWQELCVPLRDDDPDVLPEDEPPSYWCGKATWLTTLPRAAYGEVTDVCDATRRVARDRSGEWEDVVQARLLREIVGNPFAAPPRLAPALIRWHDSLLPKLAEAAYLERILPSGHLDPVRLAILADALEEAGCTDAELLRHLRGPGLHVRGCVAVDAILGRY